MSVNEQQLSWMRGVFNQTLPRTCTVKSAGVPASDGAGGWAETPTEETNVKCSFVSTVGNERIVGGAVAEVGKYVLTIEAGVSLNSNQTIVVGATDTEPVRTFQLVAPMDEPSMVGQRWLASEG